MLLGEIIEKYRLEHGLSQRQFAQRCHLSNGYIAMIEKNRNPQTGEPIIPTLTVLMKIATAIGMNLDDMLHLMDDGFVSLAYDPAPSADADHVNSAFGSSLSPDEETLIKCFRALNDAAQQTALSVVTSLAQVPANIRAVDSGEEKDTSLSAG